MGRPAKASYSGKYGCWITSAIGAVRFTKKGRAYRPVTRIEHLTHRTRDAMAAQAWVHAELEKTRSKVILGNDISFYQLTEFYLQDIERTGKLCSEAYDRAAEHLKRFGNWPEADHPSRMDALPCRRISTEDVDGFIESLLKSGRSESYITEGLIKTLKACYNWASVVKPGRYAGLPIESNPLKNVRGPKVKRRAHREESRENVLTLIVWAMRRARRMRGLKRRFSRISTVLLYALYETGARPKELCSATWADWTREDDGWSTITLEVWKNSDKTEESRVIAIPPACTRRIAWIERQPGRHDTHIFVHRRNRGSAVADEGRPEAGDPWVYDAATKGSTKSLQKWFYRLRNEAIESGVPISKAFRLYWNRSMYSTASQRGGVPTALLAKAMGTSESMLRRSYTDLHRRDVLEVAKAARKGRG